MHIIRYILALLFLTLGSLNLNLSQEILEDYVSSDPNVFYTGLLFENPELDPNGIQGSSFIKAQAAHDPFASIASSHFNYDYLPPVNTQGSQGSCTAWAIGYYLKSYQENKENNRTDPGARSNPSNICSPAFIYNMIHAEGDGGSYFSDGFRVLYDFGCPALTDMPYDDSDYQTWPDESDFENAIPQRTQTTSGDYYWIRLDSDTALNDVKLLLQNGQLVAFGIDVYYNYDYISSYSNIYTLADKTGTSRGGHAQTIVGYDDTLVTNDGVGAFRVVNSWGTGWGDSGFYWISYEAIKYNSGISDGYARWTDDRSSYSSDKKAVFELDHTYSRETYNWILVQGRSKYFFDFYVNGDDEEYRSFPSTNIVLDIKDLEAYLTPGNELRLYMNDNVSNGVGGTINSFVYEDDSGGIHISSSDTPVTINDSSLGYASLTIADPTTPAIHLNKTSITFGSIGGGNNPSDQDFSISNAGVDPFDWMITDDASWLSCSPLSGTNVGLITVSVDSSGLVVGTYTGTITVSSAEAYNSPKYVSVTLNVYASGIDSAPFGYFDTPIENSTVSGSIPVTGWALDDIEVTRVEIKREYHPDDPRAAVGPDGLVYIGDALFVKGSRPDVADAFPDYPRNDIAGWGYMMLTFGLPRRGNDTFEIYAVAYDSSGHRKELGSKTIVSDNDSRIKPFGAIDTPPPGGIASGIQYTNFGWALTPAPKWIPYDGSTLWVFMNGVALGHPVYGEPRQIIADMFPECLNKDGPVGYYYIDTTQYDNGIHTIAWSATDSDVEVDGIGSRYFQIQNVGGMSSLAEESGMINYQPDQSRQLRIGLESVERGFGREPGAKAKGNVFTSSDRPSQYMVEIEELERVVLKLKAEGSNKIIGWGRDETRGLPIGSTLDAEQGIFYWMPGPGFLGRHVLNFAVTDGTSRSLTLTMIVNIKPKSYPLKN